jgi:hypothetical protein
LPQRGTEATAQARHGCGLQDEKAPKLGGSREPRGQRKKCGVREPRVLAHCLHRCQVLRAVPMRQVQRPWQRDAHRHHVALDGRAGGGKPCRIRW